MFNFLFEILYLFWNIFFGSQLEIKIRESWGGDPCICKLNFIVETVCGDFRVSESKNKLGVLLGRLCKSNSGCVCETRVLGVLYFSCQIGGFQQFANHWINIHVKMLNWNVNKNSKNPLSFEKKSEKLGNVSFACTSVFLWLFCSRHNSGRCAHLSCVEDF